MPILENLKEVDIKGYFNASPLRKGKSYRSRLSNLTRTGNILHANVRGSHLYQVEVEVEPDGIYAECSCPYDLRGYCKHIAAVLLVWIHTPKNFSVKKADDQPKKPDELEVIPVEPTPTQPFPQLPTWITHPYSERQKYEQATLARKLDYLKVQELRQMAKKRGWKVKGTRKAAIIEQLIPQLIDPAEINKGYQALDDEHHRVFKAMALLGNKSGITEETLEQVTNSWGRLRKHKQVSTYTRHLCQAGLAISNEDDYSYPPLPDSIPNLILCQLPAPLAAHLSPTSELSGSDLHLADPLQLSRAAVQIVMLLEQQPTPLRPPMPRPRLEQFFKQLVGWDYVPEELIWLKKQGKIKPDSGLNLTVPAPNYALPDQAMERLAPIAGGLEQLNFIYSLLVHSGLIQFGSPITIWSEVKEQFLRLPEDSQRAILARAYMFARFGGSEVWQMLRHDPKLQLKRGWQYTYYSMEKILEEFSGFRQTVLQMLACLPDNTWINLDDIYSLLKMSWSEFDGSSRETYRWHYRHDTTPWWYLTYNEKRLEPDQNEPDWDLAQGCFIRQMLSGPLHWLGLVDLRFDNTRLTSVRLLGLADIFLDKVEAPPAPQRNVSQTPIKDAQDAIMVDGLQIRVVPSALNAQGHTLLDKIAILEQAAPGQFVYKLDPLATHQSFESGVGLEEILADWAKLLPLEMPPLIQQTLTEWWQSYGQVRLYSDVTIIELADDHALIEMKTVTSLEKYLLAEISPRLILIPTETAELLAAELEHAGYTPKQTDQVN